MTVTVALLILLVMTLGTTLQRITGMGVGLVAAPTISMMLGPVAGVTMSNVTATLAALTLLVVLRKDVDWRRFLLVSPLLVIGSLVGAWVVRSVDHGVLDLILGAFILIAIAAALGLQRWLNVQGWFPALTSGAFAGFMNTTAGVAAPAMTVYAVASRWEQRSMAATLQPVFLVANLSSIVTKWLFGATPGADVVPWWAWLLAPLGVALGMGLGTLLARRISSSTARKAAIAVATAGGVVALVRGITAVFG